MNIPAPTGNLINNNVPGNSNNFIERVWSYRGTAAALVTGVTSVYVFYNDLNSGNSIFNRTIDYVLTVGTELLKTVWDNAVYWFGLGVIGLTIYKLRLIVDIVYKSSNRWLVLKLLVGSYFELGSTNMREIYKLSPAILDQVVTSDPWDAFQILRCQANKLPEIINLYLANYPYDLLVDTSATGRIGEYTTRRTFKYPLLIKFDKDNQQPLVLVLYYLGKFPELLYKGDDKLTDATLQEILSLNDPRPLLKNLCDNPHIWQRSNKVERDMILTFMIDLMRTAQGTGVDGINPDGVKFPLANCPF